jgi:hypothetical protein
LAREEEELKIISSSSRENPETDFLIPQHAMKTTIKVEKSSDLG